jgi:hypothetical protein
MKQQIESERYTLILQQLREINFFDQNIEEMIYTYKTFYHKFTLDEYANHTCQCLFPLNSTLGKSKKG